MLKTVLAAACALCWLCASAQIPAAKNVLSFGHIESNDISINNLGTSNFDSFKLVGGLMFVNAKFNGKEGAFILDTGAPGLILNSKLDNKSENENYIASGLTGDASIEELTVDEFKILDIVKSDFTAYQMDLAHIEDEILHRFNGLIGSDLFSNATLVLDYKQELWGTVEHIEKQSISNVIPFRMTDHFIVVDIKISGVEYSMILDTGAEINILSLKSAEEIKKSKLKKAGTTNIQSASQDYQSSETRILHRFHMGNHVEKHQEFSILPFDFINEGVDVNLDGLIGFPFFEGKKVALDFATNLIYIYK